MTKTNTTQGDTAMKRFYFANNRGYVRYVDMRFETDMDRPEYWVDRNSALTLIAEMTASEFWFAYAVFT